MVEKYILVADGSAEGQLLDNPLYPTPTHPVVNELEYIRECVAVHRLLSNELPYAEVDHGDDVDVTQFYDQIDERVVKIAGVLPVTETGRAKNTAAISAYLAMRGDRTDPLMRVAYALCEAICY